jgi:hypothetical protein
MEKREIRGLVDVIKVSDPGEIRALTSDARIDRKFAGNTPLLNGLLIRKVLSALSFRGKRFPTMRARGDGERAHDQDVLWERLNERATNIRLGTDELDPLAQWVKGQKADTELGVLVQQAVGRLFVDSYVANPESWAAAMTLDAAPRPKSIVTSISWALTKKVSRAKTLLAGKVNGDLAGVHGTGVALHNIVKGFREMQALYVNISQRTAMSPESAAGHCLFAPAAVLRQATSDGEIAGCPFHKNAVFVLELSEAHKQADTNDLVFLEDSWSRCPAEQWVPALFEGVWRIAAGTAQEAAN